MDCRHCGRPQETHGGRKHTGLCLDQVGQDGRRFSAERIEVERIVTGLPGNGPWLISPYCDATGHNTTYAAAGKRGGSRCICPRAMALHQERRQKWNKARELARATRSKTARTETPSLAERQRFARMILSPQPTDVPAPNFSGGACAKPYNAKAMDHGFNVQSTAGGQRARETAKGVCATCPLKDTVCAPYVQAAEKPAGSWGGVWAGKDPWERMGYRLVLQDAGMELVKDVQDATS